MTRKLVKTLEFVSIHVSTLRSVAAGMDDAEFGKWSRKALDDISVGCTSSDVDELVKAMYEDSVQLAEKSRERKRAAYERHKKAEEEKAAEMANERHVEKTPEQLIYGKWANVYLTQDQFNELLKDCGNLNDLNSMIDQLSCKLEDGSIESEKHAATLSYWIEYRKGKIAQVAEAPRYKTLDERNRENYEQAIARIEAKYGK